MLADPGAVVGGGTGEGRGGAPALDPAAALLLAPVAAAAEPNASAGAGMPCAGPLAPDLADGEAGFMAKEGGGRAPAPELSS